MAGARAPVVLFPVRAAAGVPASMVARRRGAVLPDLAAAARRDSGLRAPPGLPGAIRLGRRGGLGAGHARDLLPRRGPIAGLLRKRHACERAHDRRGAGTHLPAGEGRGHYWQGQAGARHPRRRGPGSPGVGHVAPRWPESVPLPVRPRAGRSCPPAVSSSQRRPPDGSADCSPPSRCAGLASGPTASTCGIGR